MSIVRCISRTPLSHIDTLALCPRSSADRALPCGGRGRRFNSCRGRTLENSKPIPQTWGMMTMKLYFVRHGESEANRQNLHQGKEGPLSAHGEKQAHTLARRFSKIPIDFILSSSYERARQTAEIINTITQKPIEFTNLLGEWRNPSEIVGKNHDDPVSIKIRKLQYINYRQENWKYSDEETFNDFKKRVLDVLQLVSSLEKENVLLITHGAFVSFIISVMLFGENMTPEEQEKVASFANMHNTGITVCESSPRGWKLITWNDHAHLG